MIGRERERYRPLIALAAVGKLTAVALVVTPWLRGEIGPQLPALVMGDAVFAVLFVDFLRRTRG